MVIGMNAYVENRVNEKCSPDQLQCVPRRNCGELQATPAILALRHLHQSPLPLDPQV
jgi:hypothetical protein